MAIQRNVAIDDVKQAVRRDLSKPIRRAYDDAARQSAQGGGDVDFPVFSSVRSIIGRERRSHVPAIPATESAREAGLEKTSSSI